MQSPQLIDPHPDQEDNKGLFDVGSVASGNIRSMKPNIHAGHNDRNQLGSRAIHSSRRCRRILSGRAHFADHAIRQQLLQAAVFLRAGVRANRGSSVSGCSPTA